MNSKGLLLLSLSFTSCLCWWNGGHHLVARVAYDRLLETDPDVIDTANFLLRELSEFVSEGDHPLVECATFPDEIKLSGMKYTSHWHYIQNPYFEGNFTAEVHPAPQNISQAMGDMIDDLTDLQLTWDPSVPSVSPLFGHSFNLRFLVHLVGDIHQPLHSVSLYSPSFPSGDFLGVHFPVEYSPEIQTLHYLWDSAVGLYQMNFSLPMDSETWADNGRYAREIEELFPYESFEEEELLGKPFLEWQWEGYDISREFVYRFIEDGERPSEFYVKEGRRIAQKQIAKGGYRLAHLLSSMWKGKTLEGGVLE